MFPHATRYRGTNLQSSRSTLPSKLSARRAEDDEFMISTSDRGTPNCKISLPGMAQLQRRLDKDVLKCVPPLFDRRETLQQKNDKLRKMISAMRKGLQNPSPEVDLELTKNDRVPKNDSTIAWELLRRSDWQQMAKEEWALLKGTFLDLLKTNTEKEEENINLRSHVERILQASVDQLSSLESKLTDQVATWREEMINRLDSKELRIEQLERTETELLRQIGQLTAQLRTIAASKRQGAFNPAQSVYMAPRSASHAPMRESTVDIPKCSERSLQHENPKRPTRSSQSPRSSQTAREKFATHTIDKSSSQKLTTRAKRAQFARNSQSIPARHRDSSHSARETTQELRQDVQSTASLHGEPQKQVPVNQPTEPLLFSSPMLLSRRTHEPVQFLPLARTMTTVPLRSPSIGFRPITPRDPERLIASGLQPQVRTTLLQPTIFSPSRSPLPLKSSSSPKL